ncbi:50S ribosomal protein L22 [Dehalogenimonas alkenigignens]|uniref:Large ribosomal subunit protein uL22 n=1 Tax=Dehalogenimonas alkenigignens TaxID=1217799 RepID=A0A0W0GG00_9CHLR|nr:50S ribosomal protein L22 [Dehalogenimonas alkenigignens]KTB47480.1 LSU ribosomal protein L22P [Dehalogenimonas alkenigignens]PVV83461.1 50S ribosomal protein L22 [Dehalogenimonas alkenigignens]
MQVKAVSKNTGVPASKVRLYLDLVRGKKVAEALAILRFALSPAAVHVAKTVKSAAASAENNFQMEPDALKIVKIFADGAPMMKRHKARSRGRVSPILKRSSHITVIVGDQEV